MEGSEGFLQALEEALEKKRANLDEVRLPQLKESFRALQTLFDSLLNMLLRKGLLREDPYGYEQRITEISAPPDEPFLEKEKREEMSYRMAAYRGQLDFLNSYYKFSTSYLDLPRLKRVSALLGYISWKNLSEGAKSPTTRALAQYLAKIRMGTDSLATGIVKDSLAQVDKVLRKIHSTLADLVSYHRESFKCELRRKALPLLGPGAAGKREEASRALKRAFSQSSPGRPYYPELAEEVLTEELAEDAALRREKVLELLRVTDERKQDARQKEAQHREILMETTRILSRTAPDLSSALQTVMKNSRAAAEHRQSLGERIRRFLLGKKGRTDEQVYEVEYVEEGSTAVLTENVSFVPFADSVQKKATLLSSLASRGSSVSLKLESSPGDETLEFVSRQLADLHLMHRRLQGLNTYFLSEAPREMRAQMKGIKPELAAIRDGILKANQKKHDYVARKEEEEQMRRLGIR